MKAGASDIKGKITKDNTREKYRESKDLARQVKHLVKEVSVTGWCEGGVTGYCVGKYDWLVCH